MFQFGASRADDSDELRAPDDLPRELRLALWMRQISLDYQPLIDITTGDLAGVEAYVRWDRPGHGVLPARSFVEDAAGAMSALDQEVLWVSTSLWASLGGRGAHVPLHINVGLGGATKRLAGLVGRALNETQLDPALLQIDLPDSTDAADADAQHGIEGLADHGVTVNFDDSGDLEASAIAERLTSLSVGCVKINVRAGEDAAARTSAIAQAAAAAGVAVAAKGVESLDDLRRAADAGAGMAQGYLLGRPLPPDAAVELVMVDRRSRSERAA